MNQASPALNMLAGYYRIRANSFRLHAAVTRVGSVSWAIANGFYWRDGASELIYYPSHAIAVLSLAAVQSCRVRVW